MATRAIRAIRATRATIQWRPEVNALDTVSTPMVKIRMLGEEEEGNSEYNPARTGEGRAGRGSFVEQK